MDDIRDFIDYIADVECDDIRGDETRQFCEEEQPEEHEDMRSSMSEVIERVRQSGDEAAIGRLKALIGKFIEDLRHLESGDEESEQEEHKFE